MHRISRIEEYGIGSARPSFQGHVKLGFREDGKMLAADLYIVQENGPHIGGGDFRSAGNALSVVYQPDAMRWRAVPVLTNTPPVGPQRGPGENQFVAVFEPMIDKAARELKVDRLAIRRMNAPEASGKIGSDRGPLTSAFQRDALDKGAEMFKWEEKKQKSGRRNGTKVTGIGIGQGYHSAGSNGFDGIVRITPDGKLHVHTGVGNLGTYSHAGTARVAAEMLNYNWDNVIVERGDSRRGLPWNSNQAGSLTASTQSRTMYVAAMDAKEKLIEIAAQVLGGAAGDYDLGDEKVVSKTDPAKSISYAQAAQKAIELGGKFSAKEAPKDINPVTKHGLDMIAGSGLIGVAKDNLRRVGVTPGLTTTFVEIELDTETGKVSILDMLCVADCGTVLHPQGLANQIRGGQVMGIGLAMLERHVYDAKLGLPANTLLYQSKPPTYLDVPAEIGWGAVDKADPQNPVGVKGVGEPVQGSGAAAVTSAISDALGGHLFNRTPVSVDMIVNFLSKRPQAHKPLQINTV
jgi:CO/xanthine dehydrogenase Mo-binding subunit